MIEKQETMFHSDKNTTLCFSGHRELPRRRELEMLKQGLALEIDKAISDGFDRFLFGGAYGWDLLAAQMVLHRKNLCSDPSSIKLVAAIPFKNQSQNWSRSIQDDYFNILENCDEIITLGVHYFDDCYANRNKYMVEHSSQLICYWNGGARSGTGQTVNMAKKAGVPIINLHDNRDYF